MEGREVRHGIVFQRYIHEKQISGYIQKDYVSLCKGTQSNSASLFNAIPIVCQLFCRTIYRRVSVRFYEALQVYVYACSKSYKALWS